MPKYSKKQRKKIEKAEILLRKLAKTLDECDKQKVNIKLKQGIVYSKYGYVLPHKDRWVVRMLIQAHPDDDKSDDDLDS
jgi:hypothetical protein